MHNSAPFPFFINLRLWFTSGPPPQVRFPNPLALVSTQWWDLKRQPRHFWTKSFLQRLNIPIYSATETFPPLVRFWDFFLDLPTFFGKVTRLRRHTLLVSRGTVLPPLSSVCAAEVEEVWSSVGVAPSGDNLSFLQHQTQHSASPSKFSKNNFNFCSFIILLRTHVGTIFIHCQFRGEQLV